MSLRKKKREIQRLFEAFELEAAQFHGLSLSTYLFRQDRASTSRKFVEPSHSIMLWQFFGRVEAGEAGVRRLNDALDESDLQWCIRGAELTAFAVLEGEGCELFLRMAKRAGGLFNGKDAEKIKSRLTEELRHELGEDSEEGTRVFATNSHPLAVWLNFLLYHLSRIHPGRERQERIEPDPFTLSMLALERLMESPEIVKSDRSVSDVERQRFRVAVSFPGDTRALVSDVVGVLREKLGLDSVFYDFDYQAQLARPNLDTLLQDIYRNRSDLIVVFLSSGYASREWCGLEWRAIRDIIKAKDDNRVMLVRCDDSSVDGLFSIDGFIDARSLQSEKIAEYVLDRLCVLDEDS